MKPDPNDPLTWLKPIRIQSPTQKMLDAMPEWQQDAAIELMYDLEAAAAEGWTFAAGEA